MSDPGPRTEARIRRTRWPGWIWAVPIAAALVVGWLALKAFASGGVDITIVFDDAARAKPGDTQVFYRGIQMGQLKKVELSPDGGHVVMTVKMEKQAKPFLRQGTRFWLVGAEPSLSNPRSLASIVSGPTIGMQPGGGAPTTRFAGSTSPPAAKGGPLGPQYPYEVSFDGDAGALATGAPVKLRGFVVGQVRSVKLVYDPQSGGLSAPVTLELDPARLGLPAAAGRAELDRALTGWIAHGLRAQLSQDPPLVGSRIVNLEFAHGAAPAQLSAGAAYPTIPSAPSAGLNDVGQLAGKADSILTKVDAMPIEQIGQNVRGATAHIQALVASPKLADSIEHLDATLADVDRTVHEVSPQVKPLVAQLRRAADSIQQTASAAQQMVAGSPESQNSDLPAALHELTEAARSVRSLADYLDRHPEALIKGRKGDTR
jgi:paraquat-inducible protein B